MIAVINKLVAVRLRARTLVIDASGGQS